MSTSKPPQKGIKKKKEKRSPSHKKEKKLSKNTKIQSRTIKIVNTTRDVVRSSKKPLHYHSSSSTEKKGSGMHIRQLIVDGKKETEIYINGIKVQMENPPQGMKSICNGISIGEWKEKSQFQMSIGISHNSKLVISGIRINGQSVVDKVELNSDEVMNPDRKTFSPKRTEDGLYIGTRKVLDCEPNDFVSIDCIYSDGKSGINMFMF